MAQGPRVLVIDDDPAIRTLLRRVLKTADYRVQDFASDRRDASLVPDRDFDLLITDIDSRAGGLDLIQGMRALSAVPIVAISVRNGEDAAVTAFERGADDFVRKPFSNKEFLARVENVLRRRARERDQPTHVAAGDLEIDLMHRRVHLAGREVRLPVKPFEVLRVLAENAGEVLAADQILSAVWGPRGLAHPHYLRLAVRKLRHELERDAAHPRYVLTERGVGYRLQARLAAVAKYPQAPASAG